MNLNEMQQAVVDYKSGEGALLVTAAAGSGKTAVIVERVFHQISREENPTDITRLLIITFTNAAAQEMRGRISKRLRESLRENPSSRQLTRQIKLLNNADITTIDAFFLKIVREHFSTLGISSEARIADADEADAIANRILDDLLEEKYQEGREEYLNLVDMLTKRQDDHELTELIISAYRAFQSMPEPEKRLAEAVSPYEEKKDELLWVTYLLKRSKDEIKAHIRNNTRAIALIEEDEALKKAYLPTFKSDRDMLKGLLESAESWDGLREKLQAVSFQRLGPLRGYQDDGLKNRIQTARKIIKDGLDDLKKRFEDTTGDIAEDIKKTEPAMKELRNLVTAFGERFLAEKTRRKVLEFDDVAQYAYRLLWRTTPDGRKVPTREAEALKSRYDEVIVDEYQDTNRLQDEIFHAFTGNAASLLMVGDVKQSIYGFRYAEPEGFVEKLNRYTPLSDGERLDHKLALNLNYRSACGVIDGVNYFFKRLMKKEYGGIDYDREQALAAGREQTEFCPTELKIVTVQDEMNARETEAEQVALYIKKTVREKQMIDTQAGKRPVEYGDFAILMRSAQGRMSIYERALKNHGIPATASRTPGLYSTPEGEMILSLLWVVDNPYNDIALLAVLSSSAFGFSPSELAQIRLYDRKLPFIEVMRKAAEGGDSKSRDFLQLLESWRELRIREKLGIFIRRLYDDLSLPILAQQSDNGEDRVANLYEIAHRAEAFEGRGGLSAFLKATARAIENDKQPDGVKGESADNKVVLMTVHQSKGLQFPIVLLVDTATPFSTRALSENVIFQKEMGFGFKMRDHARGIQYDTVTHRAVRCRAEDFQKEEELRILYVALTRAMEKNVIFITWKDPYKKINEVSAKTTPETITGDFSSYGEWLIACLLESREGDALMNEVGSTSALHGEKSGMEWSLVLQEEDAEESTDEVSGKEKRQREEPDWEGIGRPYHAAWAVGLPTKVTATELKQSVKNAELYDSEERPDEKNYVHSGKKPVFLEEHGLNAAQKGSALHLAMQLIDIKKTSNREEIRGELERLRRDGYLSKEAISTVRMDTVWSFYQTDLGKRIRNSPKVYRELKFTLLEDAGLYREEAAGKNEKLLLQGIIDCVFLEGEDLILVDYKSDRLSSEEDPKIHALEHGYDRQLEVYRGALRRITGKNVREGWICYLNGRKESRLF